MLHHSSAPTSLHTFRVLATGFQRLVDKLAIFLLLSIFLYGIPKLIGLGFLSQAVQALISWQVLTGVWYYVGSVILALAIVTAVYFVVRFYFTIQMILYRVAAGNDDKIIELWKVCWKGAWRFAAVWIVQSLVFLVGLFFAIIPGLVWATHYWFAAYACAAEDLSFKKSFARSRQMTKGKGWVIYANILMLGSVMAFGWLIQSVAIWGTILTILLGLFYLTWWGQMFKILDTHLNQAYDTLFVGKALYVVMSVFLFLVFFVAAYSAGLDIQIGSADFNVIRSLPKT